MDSSIKPKFPKKKNVIDIFQSSSDLETDKEYKNPNYILNKYKYKWKYVGDNYTTSNNDTKSRYELPGFDGYEPPILSLAESKKFNNESTKMYYKMFPYKKSEIEKYKKSGITINPHKLTPTSNTKQNGGDSMVNNTYWETQSLLEAIRGSNTPPGTKFIIFLNGADVTPQDRNFFKVENTTSTYNFNINLLVIDPPANANPHIHESPNQLLVNSFDSFFEIDARINNDISIPAIYTFDNNDRYYFTRPLNPWDENNVPIYIQTNDYVIDKDDLLPNQQDIYDVNLYTTEWYRLINPTINTNNFFTDPNPNVRQALYQNYMGNRGLYDQPNTPFVGVGNVTFNQFINYLQNYRISLDRLTSNKAFRIGNDQRVQVYNYNNNVRFPNGSFSVQTLWRACSLPTISLVVGGVIPNLRILSTSYDLQQSLNFYNNVGNPQNSPVMVMIDLSRSLCIDLPYIPTARQTNLNANFPVNFPVPPNTWQSNSVSEREVIFPINCSFTILEVHNASHGINYHGNILPPRARGRLIIVAISYNSWPDMRQYNASINRVVNTPNVKIFKNINNPLYYNDGYFARKTGVVPTILNKPVQRLDNTNNLLPPPLSIRYGGTNKKQKTKNKNKKQKIKNKKTKKTKKQKHINLL